MGRLAANLLLILAAAFWGLGNVAQKTVLLDLGPFTTFGTRGLIGLLVISPFVAREVRRPEGPVAFCDLLAPSICFCLALCAQQIAYGGTSVTNASFLVNTTVLFTPLFGWLMLGERPGTAIWPAIILALAGVLLMAGGLTVPAWGDALCLLSAFFYSAWIVLVAKAMRRNERPFALAACQFGTAMLAGLAIGLAAEQPTMEGLEQAVPELLVLGIFSTGAAFTLQALAQKSTPPSDAAIIMSAESVFGALAAAVLLGERLTIAGTAGATCILLAIILVQQPRSVAVSALRAIRQLARIASR